MNVFGIFLLSPADIWLLGICGVLIMALIGFYFSNASNERIRFHNAVLKFREAFTPTLSQLSFSRNYKSTHEAPDIDGQMRTAIPIQTQAVEDFRFFIPKRKRGEYQQAWDDYKEAAQDGIWVAKFPGSPNEKDPYGFIESKIDAILQFAEVKSSLVGRVKQRKTRHLNFTIKDKSDTLYKKKMRWNNDTIT